MTEPRPAVHDPVARVVEAALAVAEELLTEAAERGECPMCRRAEPDGTAAPHAPECVLAAYEALTVGVAAPPERAPTRYVLIPVFLDGEAERLAAAAQQIAALGRALEHLGMRLHGKIDTATAHLLRQSGGSERFAQQPLYSTPWPGEGAKIAAARRRAARETAR